MLCQLYYRTGNGLKTCGFNPLLGNERDVTKIDRLVSGAYPAIISVANLHSIRLDTSQLFRLKEWRVEE